MLSQAILQGCRRKPVARSSRPAIKKLGAVATCQFRLFKVRLHEVCERTTREIRLELHKHGVDVIEPGSDHEMNSADDDASLDSVGPSVSGPEVVALVRGRPD